MGPMGTQATLMVNRTTTAKRSTAVAVANLRAKYGGIAALTKPGRLNFPAPRTRRTRRTVGALEIAE